MTRIQDILIRPNRTLFNVSIYLNGRWFFDSLQNPVKTYENQKYYRMSYPFALLYEDVGDPSRFAVRGSAGDYVTESADGSLGLVSRSEYENMFPNVSVSQQPLPATSTLLRNRNHLTNIVTGTTPPSYNTVTQTASRSSFSANTTTPTQPKPCNCN